MPVKALQKVGKKVNERIRGFHASQQKKQRKKVIDNRKKEFKQNAKDRKQALRKQIREAAKAAGLTVPQWLSRNHRTNKLAKSYLRIGTGHSFGTKPTSDMFQEVAKYRKRNTVAKPKPKAKPQSKVQAGKKRPQIIDPKNLRRKKPSIKSVKGR